MLNRIILLGWIRKLPWGGLRNYERPVGPYVLVPLGGVKNDCGMHLKILEREACGGGKKMMLLDFPF